MTRAEMLERISSAELTEWRAYERVTGPLGDERADAQSALVAYYIVSALGSKVRPDKLLPRWDRPPMDWRAMKAAAIAMTLQNGGTVENTARA